MSYSAMIDRTEAGPLIPEDAARDIIKEATEKSYALSAFPHKQMSRKQQRLPVFDRKPVAYFVNGDTGLKQTSDVRWDNIYLNAEEIAVIVPVPDLLVEDSAFDIWGELRPEITEAIAAKVDEAIFFGVDRPTLWPPGVLQAAASASMTYTIGTSTVDVFEDINRTMALLENAGYDPMSFYSGIRIKSVLRGQRDTAKGFLYPATGPANTGAQNAGWKGEVWNTPVFTSKMGFTGFAATTGNPFLFALDTSNFRVAIRDDINMKVFTEGVISDGSGVVLLNLMQQDAKALRVTFRLAWAAANPVTRLQPNRALRYPAAVLLQGATPLGLMSTEEQQAAQQGQLAGGQNPALVDAMGNPIPQPVETGETVITNP
jgi:HK97 family phage major capsid protein